MRKYTKAILDREFPTDDACLDFIFKARWPNGVTCKKCGKVTKHFRIRSKKAYSCEFCGTLVSPTATTIFHKSELSLRSWFYAIFLMAQTRTGVASMQLERELGVNHRTALRMFRQIRSLMGDGSTTLSGAVEADETYVGGKRPGKRGRGAAGKVIVFGMVERGGKAYTEVTPDVKAATLLSIIQEHIPTDPQTTIYTDEMSSYNGLVRLGYAHLSVNHAAEEYVNGKAHTQTVDSLWSNTKRGIDGVNHSVTPRYLQTYLDSYVWRYNHRKDEQPMFQTLLGKAAKPVGE